MPPQFSVEDIALAMTMTAPRSASALALLLLAPRGAAGFSLPPASRRVHGPRDAAAAARTHTRLLSTLDRPSVSEPAASSAAAGRKLNMPVPYGELTVGVLRETYPGENRVSVAPDSAKALVDAGLTVVVEEGGEWEQSVVRGRPRDRARVRDSRFGPLTPLAR